MVKYFVLDYKLSPFYGVADSWYAQFNGVTALFVESAGQWYRVDELPEGCVSGSKEKFAALLEHVVREHGFSTAVKDAALSHVPSIHDPHESELPDPPMLSDDLASGPHDFFDRPEDGMGF